MGGELLADRGQEDRRAGCYHLDGNASLIPPLRTDRRGISHVLFSHVIAHLLRNLKFVIKRSHNKCAMTNLNIHSLALLREGVRRTG